jgi:putative CocE/NonD family hydrolase
MSLLEHFLTKSIRRSCINSPIPTIILFFIVACVVSSAGTSTFAEDHFATEFGRYRPDKRAQYEDLTVESLYIPMRDGVKIAIDLMLPKGLAANEKIPTIIKQTRYWRSVEYRWPISYFTGPEDFERFFTSHGYAVVYMDARGSGASFGTRLHPWSRDEMLDGSEVVDWIIKQPWSNGKVGAIGTSYGGTAAEFFAVPNHPAVKAVIPRFADHDVYLDISFPGGMPLEGIVKKWAYFNRQMDNNVVPDDAGLSGRLMAKGVKPVDSDEKRELLEAAVGEHEKNADVFELFNATEYRDDPGNGTGITIDDFSPHNFKEDIERRDVAVFSWGSWFDAGQGQAVIRRFLNYSNPQRAVIGPWSHGGDHHASPYLDVDAPTDPSIRSQRFECLRFFDYFLKDVDNGVMSEKVLIYYTVGQEKWKSTTVWPPEGHAMQRYYLADHNRLSKKAPQSKTGSDKYTVNFEATTGKTNRWHTQMGGDVVYPDRSEQDARLLTYTSDPLNRNIEITGSPIITLFVSSTHSDGAIFAYLEDVDENGEVRYLAEGQLRAVHRKLSAGPPPYKMPVPYHSYERKDAMPLTPDEIAELTFGLHPISVVVKRGHSIRIAIAGADRDSFARIPKEGTPTITVERNLLHASYIDLPAMPLSKGRNFMRLAQ